ncbi:hypothetical protein QQ045_007212 [Rhodiola kirilowii]
MESPPPPPVKQSFLRRNNFVLPLLLTINVSAGAYLFLKPKEKETDADKSTATIIEAAPTSTIATQVEAMPLPTPAISQSVKARDPIPEDQQLELFKWILEEKRKVKPKDPEEKKRIDEEKAILKQFIRAKSIPAI